MDLKLRDILQKNRLSITKQRLRVFDALLTHHNAVSMNELVELCSPIDRVTVYRIIDQFENAGIVHKIQIGWKYKIELGDVFKAHHHHLTCVSCGASFDFDEPVELHSFIQRLEKVHSFEITRHTLELHGLCARCKLKT